jgi:hypothetical protein
MDHKNKTRKMNFQYKNIEHKYIGGGKRITRKVSIYKGRGYKSVCTYKNGKRKSNVRKSLTNDEMSKILRGKFIGGLFHNCQ